MSRRVANELRRTLVGLSRSDQKTVRRNYEQMNHRERGRLRATFEKPRSNPSK